MSGVRWLVHTLLTNLLGNIKCIHELSEVLAHTAGS